MNSFDIRRYAAWIGRAYRRLRAAWAPKEQAPLRQEMEQGAVIGFFAASILAVFLAGSSLSAALLILASGLGLLTGAVIGALLWVGSAKLPEDPVPSPPPGDERSKQATRSR